MSEPDAQLAHSEGLSRSAQAAVGWVCGLAAAAIWGGGAVVSRHLVSEALAPDDLVALRFASCFPVGLLLLATCGARAWPMVPPGRLLALILLAGPPYHLVVTSGFVFAPAGLGALVVNGLLPLAAIAVACLARSGNALVGLAGASIAAAGLGVVASGTIGARLEPAAVMLFAVAAVAWALLNHLVARWRVDPLQLVTALAVLSVLFLPSWLLVRGERPFPSRLEDLLLQAIYHGWLVAFVATALFFVAVRRIGPTMAALLQATTPGFAAALAYGLLGERLSRSDQIGGVLVVAGILAALLARSRSAGPPEAPGARQPPEALRGHAATPLPRSPRVPVPEWDGGRV